VNNRTLLMNARTISGHGSTRTLIECGEKDVYEQISFVKLAPEWLHGRKAPAIQKP
jgi:hypothetical protein